MADDLKKPAPDAVAEPKQAALGVPMNVYDHLDKATLVGLNEQLEADADLESFGAWLDKRVAVGSMRQIVADHIRHWNQLKAQTDEHVRGYETYTRGRLGEWAPLGMAAPSLAMFGAPKPASSTKQARNGPCNCGSGRKFKRCHGAPAASTPLT